MTRGVERTGSRDPTIARLEQRTSARVRGLQRGLDALGPVAAGQAFDVQLTTAFVEVAHGLSREPRGAFLAGGQNDGTYRLVWQQSPQPTRTILVASAPVDAPVPEVLVVF